MANKPGDRNAEPTLNNHNPLLYGGPISIQLLPSTQADHVNELRHWDFLVAMDAHVRELEAQRKRAIPKPPPKLAKPDKMHLYVDGRRVISVDADKAHTVAESYMREGRNVWLSRKVITMPDVEVNA